MNVESTENLSEIGDEQELLQYLNKDEDDNKGAPVVENKNVDDSSQKSESEKIVGDDALPVATGVTASSSSSASNSPWSMAAVDCCIACALAWALAITLRSFSICISFLAASLFFLEV